MRESGTAALADPGTPRQVLVEELRGLGGIVLEHSLIDPGAMPTPSLVRWGNSLAAALGVRGVGAPSTNSDLMKAIAAVRRRAAPLPA